jgi:pimeloyl-ACP methyl ester carboxylesterase
VLLHGYLESSEIWENFAKKLSGNHRVISVDLPGHGLSAIYGDCHSTEFMANAVKALFDCLNLKSVFLTGHSLGGYVTLAFLELFPDCLSGYCLFHSHPLPDSPENLTKREREINFVKSGKKFLMYPENVSLMFASQNLQKFRDAFQRSKDIASKIRDEGIIAALNGMMIRPSRVGVMEAGKVPCLWILGRLDNYISSEDILKKVNLPVNAKVIILENSGHLGFIEEEDLSVKIVSDFIKELPS